MILCAVLTIKMVQLTSFYFCSSFAFAQHSVQAATTGAKHVFGPDSSGLDLMDSMHVTRAACSSLHLISHAEGPVPSSCWMYLAFSTKVSIITFIRGHILIYGRMIFINITLKRQNENREIFVALTNLLLARNHLVRSACQSNIIL
jgi:hypothetical protein